MPPPTLQSQEKSPIDALQDPRSSSCSWPSKNYGSLVQSCTSPTDTHAGDPPQRAGSSVPVLRASSVANFCPAGDRCTRRRYKSFPPSSCRFRYNHPIDIDVTEPDGRCKCNLSADPDPVIQRSISRRYHGPLTEKGFQLHSLQCFTPTARKWRS